MKKQTSAAQKKSNLGMARRIRELRTRLDLSQGDLAKYLGISRVAVIKYENGSSRPVRRLDELAQVLHTTTDYLLTGRSEETPEPLPVMLEKVLLPDEILLLCKYRALDDANKQVIAATIGAMRPSKSGSYTLNAEDQ